MSSNGKVDNPRGVGLFGLIGLVVSSCIGSGVFALTGQLANVASPGAAIVAWVVCDPPKIGRASCRERV